LDEDDITGCNGKEWTTYVRVMMKSEIHEIELVARMVGRDDIDDDSSRLSTLPEAVVEQGVECGIVLTQPSQETHDDTDADEPPIVASNEIVLTVEYVLGGVGVADIIADVGMILGVDPHPTATVVTLSVDASFVDPEFMPEYDAVFGDELAEDSADDRLVPEISNRDKAMLQ
jgi:hypothetical protein